MAMSNNQKTPAAQRRAVKSYEQRQAAAGLIQVRVWVPAEKADRLRAYAKRLREE